MQQLQSCAPEFGFGEGEVQSLVGDGRGVADVDTDDHPIFRSLGGFARRYDDDRTGRMCGHVAADRPQGKPG